MAFQMVYTSVRSGLVAGRSGFCTAARHKDLKESLVARLEDFSAQYDRGLAGGAAESQLPVIYQYRIITIREDRYYVLMRLGDAGNDYTGRTNHIAHSLVLSPTEVAGLRLNPAEVILGLTQRGFWRTRYDEPARYFGNEDIIDLTALPPAASLPAVHWSRRTGSPANAAQLFDSNRPTEVGVVLSGCGEADGSELLRLFAESLLLLGPDRSNPQNLWSVPFTSILQSSSEKSHFRWCGILQSGTLLPQEARSGRKILTLVGPLTPPTGVLAEIAQGLTPSLSAGVSEPEESPSYRSIPFPNESGQPPVATIISGTSGSPAPPSAEVESESFVSISLEDPKRAKRAGDKRNGRSLVLVAGIAVLVAGVGWAGYWFAKRDVREHEKIVRNLSGEENWADLKDHYEKKIDSKLLKESKFLEDWKTGSDVITDYLEIKTQPHRFQNTEPKSDLNASAKRYEPENSEMAKVNLSWQPKEKDLKEEVIQRIKEEQGEANTSINLWQDTITLLTAAWASAEQRFEQGEMVPGNVQGERTKEIQETLNQLSKQAADSESQLNELYEILTETITPAINEWEEINGQNSDEAEAADGKKKANELKESLKPFEKKINALALFENPGEQTDSLKKTVKNVYGLLITKFEGLSQPAALKPKPSVTESTNITQQKLELPTDQSDISEAEEKVSIPKTYIVRRTAEGDVDLSGVHEIEANFPADFSILPISALKIEKPESPAGASPEKGRITITGDKIYSKGTLLLSGAENRKLKVELGDENSKTFWGNFPGGFVLQFPKTQNSTYGFRIAVVDELPTIDLTTNASEVEHLFQVSVSEFVKRSPNGEISLAPGALRIIDNLAHPGEAAPRFDLSLPELSLSSRGSDAKDLTIPILPDISARVQKLEKEKESVKLHQEKWQALEPYRQLVSNLFPDVLLNEGIHNLIVTNKLGTRNLFYIEQSKVPVIHGLRRETVDSLRKSSRQTDQDFPKQVQFLFKSLEALAKGNKKLNEKASPLIEKYIFKADRHNENGDQNQDLFGWIKIAEESKKNSWSKSEISSPQPGKPHEKKQAADKELEDYLASKYFSDFFKRWEEMFNKEKAEEFFKDRNMPPPSSNLQTISIELESLKKARDRFENSDLIDDGDYTLNVIYGDHSIPLIKGVRLSFPK